MAALNPRQFRLDDIEHGPEVPHALRELGVDPSGATFTRTRPRVSALRPTHVDDIEDDEDYHRTVDMLGERGLPPIITAKHQGKKVILDGYARTNAAHSEGRSRITAYHLND